MSSTEVRKHAEGPFTVKTSNPPTTKGLYRAAVLDPAGDEIVSITARVRRHAERPCEQIAEEMNEAWERAGGPELKKAAELQVEWDLAKDNLDATRGFCQKYGCNVDDDQVQAWIDSELAGRPGQVRRWQVNTTPHWTDTALPIFEKRRPDDKRPRAALDLAERWGRGETVTREELAAVAAALFAAAWMTGGAR